MDTYLILSDALIMVFALIPIYAGSLYSVKYIKGLAPTTSYVEMSEVKYIPVTLSVVIVSLYLLVRFFFKEYVNVLVMLYFALVALYSSTDSLRTAYYLLSNKSSEPEGFVLNVSISNRSGKNPKEVLGLEVDGVGFISFAFSSTIIGLYLYTKNWMLNNTIAELLCFTLLTSLKIDTLKTALVLLAALLATDVFWVFATDVMITVAKNIDVPIKIIVPKDAIKQLITGEVIPKSEWRYSFLGLGDIVIPGVFISFCLLVDLILHDETLSKKKTTKQTKKDANLNFKKPYFYTSMVGYTFGLVAAYFFAITYKTGQPALLYLVPFSVLPVITLAYSRGELRKMYDMDMASYYKKLEEDETTHESDKGAVTKRTKKTKQVEPGPTSPPPVKTTTKTRKPRNLRTQSNVRKVAAA